MHRTAGVLREDRGLEGGVAARVAAVRPARHLRQDAHGRCIESERLGDLLAQPERSLRAGVDHGFRGTHVGDGRARSDRRVRDRRQRVCRFETQGALRERVVHSGVLADRDVPALPLRRRAHVPVDVDRVRGGARLRLALGDDADEIAGTDDRDDAGHGAGHGVVDATHASAPDRRPDDDAVRHARDANVGRVPRLAGHDVARLESWHRLPAVATFVLRTRPHLLRDRARERLLLHELRVPDAFPAAVAHGPVLGTEALGGLAEDSARAGEELRPRERRGAAEHGRLLRDGAAAERPHVVRDLRGVAEHHAHALDGDVELVGDDLREGGADPLPEFDLPGERHDGAVRLDADALLQAVRLLRAPAHDAASAARFTAAIARTYTPHRQRLAARASRTVASDGCGSRARSAAADTIMPLVQ